MGWGTGSIGLTANEQTISKYIQQASKNVGTDPNVKLPSAKPGSSDVQSKQAMLSDTLQKVFSATQAPGSVTKKQMADSLLDTIGDYKSSTSASDIDRLAGLLTDSAGKGDISGVQKGVDEVLQKVGDASHEKDAVDFGSGLKTISVGQSGTSSASGMLGTSGAPGTSATSSLRQDVTTPVGSRNR